MKYRYHNDFEVVSDCSDCEFSDESPERLKDEIVEEFIYQFRADIHEFCDSRIGVPIDVKCFVKDVCDYITSDRK